MATTLTFSLFFTFTLTLISLLFLTNAALNGETPPPTPNLIAPPPPQSEANNPFRPGIAVVACVLTTMFSLTSLLLLYIKHCGNVNIDAAGVGTSTPWTTAVPFAGRKNSGIDRTVVESLPVFRFGALRGQKDGLDCAVCLTKFEAAEVLRLLPKCKHAFHVECVDTWLDAHSTCPLCRYRVDPEDILLVDDTATTTAANTNTNTITNAKSQQECVGSGFVDLEKQEIVESKRRHSSVGERERERVDQSKRWTTSFRRSLDSVTAISRKKNESVSCFVRARKDGMLLLTTTTTQQDTERERVRTSTSVSLEQQRRLEHRIIVSPGPVPVPGPGPGSIGVQQRWSDVQASDLLYLKSEMIMSEAQWNNTRGGGRRKRTRRTNDDGSDDSWNGRGIINSRSVSEITGLSRFSTNDNHINSDLRVWEQHQERQEGLVRRWLGWISLSISKSS